MGMGTWHQCEDLKERNQKIRIYVWGEAVLYGEKNMAIRLTKCPWCDIVLSDLVKKFWRNRFQNENS